MGRQGNCDRHIMILSALGGGDLCVTTCSTAMVQLVHLLPSWPLVPTACSLLGLALALKQFERGNYIAGWETLRVSLSLA